MKPGVNPRAVWYWLAADAAIVLLYAALVAATAFAGIQVVLLARGE